MPSGRETKCTRRLIKRIAKVLEDGNTRKAACAHCHIVPQTFLNWMESGATNGTGIHFEFMESIKKAEAKAEMDSVAIIRSAAHESWQAAGWYLERKNPEDWRLRQTTEHTGTITQKTEEGDARANLFDALSEIASRVTDTAPPEPQGGGK